MDKSSLTERDICTKYITPALTAAGWDLHTQIREEVSLTQGRIIVRGKLTSRGKAKRADYVLYYKPNIPIAVIEAKDNTHSVGAGMQQVLEYAQMLGVPFGFSSNGDAFLEHNGTEATGQVEREIPLASFTSPETLWQRYCAWQDIDVGHQPIVAQDYYKRRQRQRAPRAPTRGAPTGDVSPPVNTMMPWMWFGITTNASRSISGNRVVNESHTVATIFPASFNHMSLPSTSPNRHALFCVQIVRKYAPSWV